jgi:putative ABC transport system permease protein
MNSLLRDLRHGLRLMLRSPGVAAAAVVALALAIAANTIVFSVVDNILLRGLPVRDASTLVSFAHYNPQRNVHTGGTPYADVVEWRRQMPSFEQIAAVQRTAMTLGLRDEAERVNVARVNHNFFAMLGVMPAHGRGIAREEDRPGAGHVAVSSYALSRRFGGPTAAAGKTILLDGEPYKIIGVMPARFRFTGEVRTCTCRWRCRRREQSGDPACRFMAASSRGRQRSRWRQIWQRRRRCYGSGYHHIAISGLRRAN